MEKRSITKIDKFLRVLQDERYFEVLKYFYFAFLPPPYFLQVLHRCLVAYPSNLQMDIDPILILLKRAIGELTFIKQLHTKI